MPDDPNADAEAVLARSAAHLADRLVAAIPSFVERSVGRIYCAYRGEMDPTVAAAAQQAGIDAQESVGSSLRTLLERDIDLQTTNPMTLLRGLVAWPTAVLRDAGVPPVVRDPMAEAQFPEDDYDLVPTKFADLDPDLHDVGLEWGAAKAFVWRARRRGEGRT